MVSFKFFRQFREGGDEEVKMKNLEYSAVPLAEDDSNLEEQPFRKSGTPFRQWKLFAAVAAIVLFCVLALREFHVRKVAKVEEFIELAMNTDIDGAIDTRPLEILCSNAEWREGLFFRHRDTTGGGGGNVRNVFLNGVRYAIEAGAGYVMPRILLRDSSNLLDLQFGLRDFSYLYDRAHFKSTLAKACPKMTIYDDFDDLAQETWANNSLKMSPNQLDEAPYAGYTISQPRLWRARFDAWLESQNATVSTETPVMVLLENAFLEWPIHADPPAFVRTFGRILRSPERVRRLAALVLKNLNSKYNIAINPEEGITQGKYFGAHLRTAKDVEAAHWTGYESQAPTYINCSIEANLSLIYAASGDPEHLKQFGIDAANRTLTVVTKSMLLHGEDLEELEEMSWDQQGLVDYEMMLKASRFAGLGISSFSYNIAVRRHASLMTRNPEVSWTSRDLDLAWAPWWSKETNVTRLDHQPNDELSLILGHPDIIMFASALWP